MNIFNPWDVSLTTWLSGYGLTRLILFCFVDGFVWAIAPKLSALPSRLRKQRRMQHRMDALEFMFLFINSNIEYVFAQHVMYASCNATFIARSPYEIDFKNGFIALWLLIVVDDMLYAPMHRFMHQHTVYKYIHKYHHRNTFPSRGYVDAAYEHPIEQMVALTLHWCAIRIVAYFLSRLHVVSVTLHIFLKALGACFNHTGCDVCFTIPGPFFIDYSVRSHETHHRNPQKNFAQYVMFWDRLMGTYQHYQP